MNLATLIEKLTKHHEKLWDLISKAIILGLTITMSHLAAQTSWTLIAKTQAIDFDKNKKTSSIQTQARDNITSTNNNNHKISNIASLHLFGDAEKIDEEIDEAVEDTLEAPETDLQLDLLGVFVAEIDSDSKAILKEQSKRDAVLYQVGDKVPGNALLHAVYSKKVILKRKGKLETLNFAALENNNKNNSSYSRRERQMSRSEQLRQQSRLKKRNNKRNTRRKTSSSRSNAPDFVDDIRNQRVKSANDLISRYKNNLDEKVSEALEYAQLEETTEGFFKVTPESPAEILTQVGVRRGDIIKKVNGFSLSELKSSQSKIERVIKSGTARIEVQRGKRTFYVSYPFN